jgi:Xaa-Pro aminopeptidase
VDLVEKAGPHLIIPMQTGGKTMRLEKLRQSLAEENLDAILVSGADNRRYLSGFTGSAGHLLISPDRAVLATDFRYYEQVGREAGAFELARITTTMAALLPELLAEGGIRRLGFEGEYMTVSELQTLNKATDGVEWVPLKETVARLRAIKDEAEIELLRRSAALNDEALDHLTRTIRPGMTEREAAWEIEAYMRGHGASKVAFDLIVAAGPNGALPHARPGDRVIEEGQPVVVDMGCVLDGYCSDMTRTFCLGEPSAHYLEVWQIVLRAQEAALHAVRAGLSGVAADAAARDVIEAAGYGEQFGHGTGHGVGLAVHEKPRAGRLSEDTLQAGMSLTVEPGIYLPGQFGVRIEDLVIVREDGIENLTGSPKAPVLG